MKYLAHKNETGKEQLLIDHLQSTSRLTAFFAKDFAAEQIGAAVGLYHDLGKYSAAFQDRIQNDGPKVDHSTAGAKELYRVFPLASFCIAGHHSGLMDRGSAKFKETGSLSSRIAKELDGRLDYSDFTEEFLRYNLKTDYSSKDFQQSIDFIGDNRYSVMFFTRMLFSCLVDADYLETEDFMYQGEVKRGDFASLSVLYERYKSFVTRNLKSGNTRINIKRNSILQECLSAAHGGEGLYSLTVPTGGGKTIASLGFALEHARVHQEFKKRIIYVIPYTSIIEQTADIFRNILGEENIIEHHINVDYDQSEESDSDTFNKYKLATENWDAPVIVTTNVQFFESLYSAKSSRCRKLHNITNSVIVFDEAQMLPNEYLKPCVRAIEELVKKYHVSAVLCTATQPNLSSLLTTGIDCKEICHDVEELYNFFRRVSYQKTDFEDIDALAAALNSCKQALCIVNTRKAAQEIFTRLKGEKCFHLSTLMCPEHRRRRLSEIRDCLANGEPCLVVATNLVEAGVDVDFPVVYRELAGLDSIIQAGGRCNREGKYSNKSSIVYVFELIHNNTNIPSFIKLPQEITKMVMHNYDDIASIAAINEYFTKLHTYKGSNLDQKNIVAKSTDQSMPFAEIADEFVVIKNAGRNIFIPYDANGLKIAFELRSGKRSRNLLRRAGQYMINVYEHQFQQLNACGVLEIEEDISILLNIEYYSQDVGLHVEEKGGKGIFL